jgi:small subunit ribosomal protein S6
VAQQAPLYDLTLLLSMAAPDEQRSKVLADVQTAIASAGGQIERNDAWGRRPTAFQINHQAEAEYHLLQFTAPPETIAELSHTLHITDGVLRFRVIKNRPGTPPAPSSPPPVVVAATAPSPGAPAAQSAAPPAAPQDTETGASEATTPVTEPMTEPATAPVNEPATEPVTEAPADVAPPEGDDSADE